MKKKVVAVIIAVGLLITILSVRGGDVEDVSGSYKNVSVFANNQIVLNSDKSWDADIQDLYSYDIKHIQGVYETRFSGIKLKSKFSDAIDADDDDKFKLINKEVYYYRSTAYFDKDDDYGSVASFDENGRSNQSFVSRFLLVPAASGEVVSEDKMYIKSLKFNEDGTFLWFNGIPEGDTLKNVEYEGTYSVNEDIITLHYNNTEHFLILDDGVIYYDVYQKQN